MYLTDPKTGQKSVTLTAFAVGFIVAVAKLLFSGIEINTFKLSEFSGVDFAAVIGALGAVYTMRRRNSKDSKTE